jgi:hypothetical protein
MAAVGERPDRAGPQPQARTVAPRHRGGTVNEEVPMKSPLCALVIYESMFGNTEQLARAVAEGLELDDVSVTVREVGEATLISPRDVDLLVVGAPTHAFSLSRPSTRDDAVRQGAPESRAGTGLREWLAALPAGNGLGIAVFDTRVSKVRRLPMAAGPRAAKIARQRGYTLLSKPVGFVVDDVKGPLGHQELERAVQWGRFIAGVARIHVAAEQAQRPAG